MKLDIKYREIAWWFWLLISLCLGAGLAGWQEGYYASAAISFLNLAYYAMRDRTLVSFSVQVRAVWLALVLVSLTPALWLMNVALFIGIILVIFFDRCGIARVLIKMPWNKNVELT